MMRILVPSLTSIDLDLVKDALGQLAVTVTMISSCSQTYLFFFLFPAWIFEHTLFPNKHYTVPKPSTANEQILCIHKLFTQVVVTFG